METTIDLPPIVIPHRHWLTSNGRYHWADKANRVRHIRQIARYSWNSYKGLQLDWPQLVVVRVQYPTKAKADPLNAEPSIKAAIDGGTDAGLWPDDSAEYIVGPLPMMHRKTCEKGAHVLHVSLLNQRLPF